MTTPGEERAPDVPAGSGPTVSTAPARSRWSWSRVPSHVGPARTSTIVIAVLFVLLLALHSYLQAHAQSGYTTVTTDTGQQVRVRTADLSGAPTAPSSSPATASTTAPATTTARSATSAPTASSTSATTTASQRTTSSSATRTSAPATSTSGGAGSTPTIPTTAGPSS